MLLPCASLPQRHGSTFVQVQLLLFLLLLLLRLLRFRPLLGLGRHPLDLPGRLLPLPALVQRRLGRLADEVIGLGLGQDGSPLALQEELGARERRR